MSIPRAWLVLLLASFLSMTETSASANAQAPALPDGVTKGVTVEGITEYKLANGLRVLLLQDASQPKVTVNATIFVGSRHEGYGETGMAHLLEHMVFKGCPKFPDVPKALRDHGANFNGTTSVDRTNYFETMSATDENLEFGIELEADRMVNSFIAREELMKEFTVVRSEFERGENNPVGILFQRMQSSAFVWHNYGKSTIGNRTDIERVPVDSLKAFYKKFYQPDNAFIVIAGKFDAAKALALTAKHFGSIPKPTRELPVTYTEEPPQDGERVVTLRRVGEVGATGAVYHIPAASHPDYPACEILANVLSTQPNGRLYKALVEAKKASGVFAFARNTFDPGTMTVIAMTEADKTESTRDAMIGLLESLFETPITAEEVERARLPLIQQRERTLANTQLFAISLSDWAGCGDWRLFFIHRDRLEKVSAADVNRVATKYLIRSNRTVGIYVPTKQSERAQIPGAPPLDLLVDKYVGRAALSAGEAFDPTPENVEKRVVRGKLASGLSYAYLPKKTRGETVNLSMVLRFGNADSLKGKTEPAEYMGAMLNRGTKSKTRQQIKDEFDRLGSIVSIGSDPGDVTITLQTKRANLPATLALLKEILREPNFPEAEFEVLKREQLEGLEQNRTDPQALADNALSRKLAPFPPDDTRYVPTFAESKSRLTALTVANVREVYETQLSGTSGEVAIVGDFDPKAATMAIEAILEGWTSTIAYKRISEPAVAVEGGVEKIITPDKANAVYVAGLNVAIQNTDPDYAALIIGNYALGEAPLASRLSVRVRGKEGLSYGVRSAVSVSSVEKNGRFNMSAITNPDNMGKVDTIMAEELKKFLSEGMSASELEEVKKAFIQTLRGRRANDGALAGQLVNGLYAGRTFEYYADLEKKIEALQPGDIKKAFDKLIDQKKLVIIQAGDLDKKPAPKTDEKK